MSITAIARDWGVNPSIVRITSTDTLTTIGTAGYLTAQADNITALNAGAFEWVATDFVLVSASNGWGFFSISSDFTSLTAFAFAADVIGTPVVVGDFAIFQSTSGNLEDLGFSPSDPAQTKVAMVNGTTAANALAVFADTAGTLKPQSTTATLAFGLTISTGNLSVAQGNISAGSSGHAGTVSSFPGTAANGAIILAGVNAGGAFNTTISNGTMGQSTVYTLGDIGASTGGIVVATAAIRMKSVAQAVVAGGAAAQTVTDAFCTSASSVICTWNDTTNAVSIQKAVAGNGSFVVTSSADPGASHLNYIIIK
jgi:hypothetical protein